MMYTIGHSNHSMEEFVRLISLHGVDMLVDVRSSPQSRYLPHFNRVPLRKSLLKVGVDYRWAGRVLGGLNRIKVESPIFKHKIGKVVDLSKDFTVALMCSEGAPETCHRVYKLSAWLRMFEECTVINHISRKGELIPNDVMLSKVSEDLREIGLTY